MNNLIDNPWIFAGLFAAVVAAIWQAPDATTWIGLAAFVACGLAWRLTGRDDYMVLAGLASFAWIGGLMVAATSR